MPTLAGNAAKCEKSDSKYPAIHFSLFAFCNRFCVFCDKCTTSPNVRPHLHTNTNKAGWGEAYANICLDCNTRQNVVVHRGSEWFSLKYRLQADSVRLASDWTEAVFLSLVTRLHRYACLASARLTHIFVLMWTRLYRIPWLFVIPESCQHSIAL